VVCLRDVVEGWGERGMKGCFCASVGQQKEEQTGGQLSFVCMKVLFCIMYDCVMDCVRTVLDWSRKKLQLTTCK
jgi:hypothetical protein